MAAGAEPIEDEFWSALTSALQTAPQGQWIPAAESLRPFADDDNPIATALVAMWMGQGGQWAQGLPYAERAVRGPIAPGAIAVNYANWVAGDPNHRNLSVEFWQAALDAGWNIDPIGQANQLASQGNLDGAIELLRTVQTRTLPQLEQAWERLNRDLTKSQQQLDSEFRQVSDLRASLTAKMNDDASSIETERKRIEQLVTETTSLIQSVASDTLASEYAKRAKTAYDRSRNWAYATLGVSIAAILIAATFVLVGLAKHHDVGTVLARAAISLPLLALAAYLNKLSTDERRDSRNWTHIELQIRTAQPYLGNLPEALRDEVQAALALRFFPGQAQDPHGGAALESDPDDVLKLIKEILARKSQG